MTCRVILYSNSKTT